MSPSGRPRVALREAGGADERREWTIVVDGVDAGSLTAERDGDSVWVSYAVDGEADIAVLQQAIGQLVGAPPFPDTQILAAVTDAADSPRRRLLDATGFERVSVEPGGMETWQRAAGIPPRTGPERFLDRHGRIEKLPVKDADLHELLEALVSRVLSPNEVLTESEINDRIRPITDDVAFLRRAFVDHELVERTMSGRQYALVDGVDNS